MYMWRCSLADGGSPPVDRKWCSSWNCNTDNVDALFQQHPLLMIPSEAIQLMVSPLV
jgi:hypothetical protein